MPSITPMISAIYLLLVVIPFIVVTTSPTTAPPRRAVVLHIDVQHPLSSRDQLGN